MAATSAFDDLMRAAEAAGYAMASPEDDAALQADAAPVALTVSAEDSARGARRVALPASHAGTGTTSMVPKTVRSGATSVRDTVYGYLGFGVPA
jgi:hypothetical protein